MSTDGIGKRIAAEASLHLQSIVTGTYGQQRPRGVIQYKNPSVQAYHEEVLLPLREYGESEGNQGQWSSFS